MNHKGFTLVELLIVIGVLAVLTTVLVLILSPVQFMAQGRDTTRVNDVQTLNKAINLSKAMGSLVDATEANKVYVSLPDTNANLTDDCRASGEYPTLPALATGWQYRCVASADNLRKVDGTGWLSINFSSVPSIQPPLVVLPVDPINNPASLNYYAYGYDTDQNTYAIAAKLDSEKYISDLASNARDGGNDATSYETRPTPWFAAGGGGGGGDALFAGSDDSIFKCLPSTGCDVISEWVDVTGASFPAANDFAVDTVNNVIYAATAGNEVYRCDLSTGCDIRTEWISVFNTGTISLNAILFDPATQALYAGGEAGLVYRCAISTGCDGGGVEWLQIMDLSGQVDDIVLDSSNTIYLNERFTFGGGSIIRRCLASTSCDALADWVPSFDGTAAGDSVSKMTFDAINSVIYAAGFDATGGELWRCNVASTSCDASGDWTKPYSIGSTNFVSALVTDDVLYIGEDFVDNINRCPISSGCDAQTDFTRYSLPGSGSNIYALSFDLMNSIIYAGTGDFGIIYQCLISSSCDASADWTIVADTVDFTINEIIYKSW